MTADYDALAPVYEWLIPDDLVEPGGAAAAFAQVLDALPPGARVLDCAAGVGQLAVGLALRGSDVVATDLSPAMVERTRELARQRGIELHAAVCAWDTLGHLGRGPFDAVFCVGNSLAHTEGRRARRSALSAMRSQLRSGGLLIVTSRNWELVRARGSGLQMPDRLVVRGGVSGIVVYSWTIPDDWGLGHYVDVGVALLHDEAVTAHAQRLSYWPFTVKQLREDMEGCGFVQATSSYRREVERYLVTATAT